MAKGYTQCYEIYYHKTFSLVVKATIIQTILALATKKNWLIHQLNVSNAFLHGHLDEEVYMEQPQGFIDRQHPTYVCHLHKSLYELKQDPRAWFHMLYVFLCAYGFHPSKANTYHFIFTNGTNHYFFCVMLMISLSMVQALLLLTNLLW